MVMKKSGKVDKGGGEVEGRLSEKGKIRSKGPIKLCPQQKKKNKKTREDTTKQNNKKSPNKLVIRDEVKK